MTTQRLIQRIVQIFRRDSAFSHVLSNSGWLLSANLITMVLGFSQGAIVARMMGANSYGILTLITTYQLTLSRFVGLQVWETIIKFVTQYREQGDIVKATATVKLGYLLSAVTGILACLCVFATADLAAHLFVKDASTSSLIRVYAVASLLTIPEGTSLALLRISDHFKWLTYQNVGVGAFRFIGVIGVMIFHRGVAELLIVFLLAETLRCTTMVILGHKSLSGMRLAPWRQGKLSSLVGEYGQIGRFLIATNTNSILKVLRNSDVLLIGYWLTPTEVGFFRLARSITNVMGIPTEPIYTASYPEFAKLWHQRDLVALRRLVRKLVASTASIAMVTSLGIWLTSEWLIRLIVGGQYLPSLPVLRWLTVAMGIAVATSLGRPLLLAIGRALNSLLATALGTLGQFVILVLLLPRVGVASGGIAYLGFCLIWVLVVAISAGTLWRKQAEQ
jgi:O-antigen/teichoic acid export membrane protein